MKENTSPEIFDPSNIPPPPITPDLPPPYKSPELKEFSYSLIPERIRHGLIENSGEQIKADWSPEKVQSYSLEKYALKMKESSGHFAVHGIARPDLFLNSLERGYVRATGVEEEKPQGYMAYESLATHFCVDDVYWKNIEAGFLCSVESLLENKAFMDSPLKADKSNEDWPLTGLSDDLNDETHKFKFDELGVVLLPKSLVETDFEQDVNSSWYNSLSKLCQKLGINTRGLLSAGSEQIVLSKNNFDMELILNQVFEKMQNRPKRIYFYQGSKLNDGVKEFLEQNQITPKDRIPVSGKVELIRTSDEVHGGAGKGNFYAIANNQNKSPDNG